MTKTPTANQVKLELKQLADPARAIVAQGFFKTGPGQYGEGDKFIGITVPVQRQVAKSNVDMQLSEVERLLQSPVHEHRLTALFILISQYKSSSSSRRKTIISIYKKNLRFINNWDLVDSSAPQLLGDFLIDKPRAELYKLARSGNLWRRRIAIISTLRFIAEDDFKDTLAISEILLSDDEDLIHKAVGWMLGEVGNRDKACELSFLELHGATMPRTTLRYAIERFPKKDRKRLMNLKKK
ncbi:MAG: DNA alkylation repair protein [Candidatus Kerfeldbacteria bacterium CG15_BIG_FIL_POST_REV_8_21_14_020_45_12]|uniref:DNA alkylation repair protein n=1 Tax=Candidatus Kerfeldbacteria bacterium CG15_BIG_FIL_POST_REV_8_21_14_020_45_12 TaxID=2014247 RepID=A0A2M7H515_9BACT|nr:MAG: DNA alkylation repair protein [Candidatus Kerfeldbacteria bacterium CG15_BIG_FIL_POST_REV_8_21_14_020_45_12]PJA93191.1 MAG: DNA alkylation repair protein [Candidatus Kerfeldbacteria bacterium CG_4_9_14_3_um_filter_45_8]